jgi:hypothetical protein
MLTAEVIELREQIDSAVLFAIDRDGFTLLECQDNLLRLIRSAFR